jgi:outer membrane protein TolC
VRPQLQITWKRRLLAGVSVVGCTASGCATDLKTVVETSWKREQQTIETRDPSQFAPTPIPQMPAPLTVADDETTREPYHLSLNEAIRITLENAKVIRVYTGLSASNSGRTIYDTAIANTLIDQAQSRFDPSLNASVTHNRNENPSLGFDPTQQSGIGIVGPRLDADQAAVGISKLNTLGGRLGLDLSNNRNWLRPYTSGLNPENRNAVTLSYTQPLLQGGGFQYNMAPIVLARLDTERSYFQFKDQVQELVRGTIEAYWSLVFSRLAVWAREIQYEQAKEAFGREDARQKAGIGDLRNVAQAKVTLNQFKASLIAAKADVLAREAALRNILGMVPSDGKFLVPVSAPTNLRYKPGWEKLLQFAEQRRPDIIELKLVLEADQQRKIQAENVMQPQLDATALYRWNGLNGRLPPYGEKYSSDASQFTDWTVGVNFSVPLGLREGRARVREQDLLIMRDRANLDQQLHFVSHELAITVRGLENTYEQYLAYKETRSAALTNLLVQIQEQKSGRGIYLSVLQALNDWGNSILSEAQTMVDYNILLTNLEKQTGTILETHGLVFVEERFQSFGPWIKHEHQREYPQDLKPVGEPKQFPPTPEPSENTFDLKRPQLPRVKPAGAETPIEKFAEERGK